MKNLIVILSAVLVMSTSQASTSVVEFVGDDLTIETNLCLIAAKDGFSAAKKEAKKVDSFSRVKCNGMTIKNFAKIHNPVAATKSATSNHFHDSVLLIPADHSSESELCIRAAKVGIHAIGIAANQLKCNGEDVSRFIRNLKKS